MEKVLRMAGEGSACSSHLSPLFDQTDSSENSSTWRNPHPVTLNELMTAFNSLFAVCLSKQSPRVEVTGEGPSTPEQLVLIHIFC